MSIMPQEPFQWGAGGRRMTPEQIDQQRQIAASLMQTDYSPIASPWQGLARVASNVTGALQSRSLDRAQNANAAESQSVIQALMAPGAAPEVFASAATNQNLDPMTRKFAMGRYETLTEPVKAEAPKSYEFDATLRNAGIDPASPEGMALYRQRAANMADPFQVTPIPGGTYAGPRSGLGAALGVGQPSQAPAMPNRPPIGAIVKDPFGDGGQTPASGSFP